MELVMMVLGILIIILIHLPSRPRRYVKPHAKKIDDCTVEVTGSTSHLERNFHHNSVAQAQSFERMDDGTTLIHLRSESADALAEAINISENL